MKVAIVGYPNVGKSSLVNRLCGVAHGGRARAPGRDPRPQRDRREWNGRRFTLVDTGGIDVADADPIAGSIREQAQAALSDAQAACSSSTPRAGLRPGDEEVADLLRRSNAARPRRGQQGRRRQGTCRSPTTPALGLGDPVAVSAPRASEPATCWTAIVELLPRGTRPGRKRAMCASPSSGARTSASPRW